MRFTRLKVFIVAFGLALVGFAFSVTSPAPTIYAAGCGTDESSADAECEAYADGDQGVYAYVVPGGQVPGGRRLGFSANRRTLYTYWDSYSGQYRTDSVRVCFFVPGPGSIRVDDVTYDRNGYYIGRANLYNWYDDGNGYCWNQYFVEPTGRECLILQYGRARYVARMCFTVM